MNLHFRYHYDFEHYPYMDVQEPINDLLVKQSKGEFLSHDEKNRVATYAEQKRKERLNKH